MTTQAISRSAPTNVGSTPKPSATPSSQAYLLGEEHIQFINLPEGYRLSRHEFAQLPKERKECYLSAMRALLGDSKVQKILNDTGCKSVEFSIDKDGVFLSSKGKKFLLSSFKEITEKTNKAFLGYYTEICSLQKHVAIGNAGSRFAVSDGSSVEMQKIFQRKQKEITQNGKKDSAWWEWAKPAVCTLADGTGGVRNAVASGSSAVASSTAVTAAGVVGGVMGVLSGSLIAIAGQDALDKASKVNFEEGMTSAHLFRGAGIGITAMGAAFITSKAASLAGNAAVAAPAMMFATLPLYIAWNAVLMGFAAYNFHHTKKFYDEVLSYLENPAIAKDQRLTSFLRFLKEELMVSPLEVLKMKGEIEKKYPTFDKEEIQAKLNEEIGKKIEEKRMRLEKRVGSACVQKILGNVDRILQGLQNPTEKETALKEAEKLAFEVRKESFKKMVVFAVIIFLTILGIAAAIAAMVFTGPLPYILFAIAGLVWMTVDSGVMCDKIGDFGWAIRKKWHGEEDPPEDDLVKARTHQTGLVQPHVA
jgi:hypothetical protein